MAKIFQGLGSKRRESSDGDWVYYIIYYMYWYIGLGTRWAKYPFSRCRSSRPARLRGQVRRQPGLCFRKGRRVGVGLGRFWSLSPVLLPRVLARSGRKGKHKCWNQSYISKGIWRQGIGSFVRNSYVSTLCPVAICPYLCTPDGSRALQQQPLPTVSFQKIMFVFAA